MGQITLTIAGRNHKVGCRDGEEPKLRALGAMLDRHAPAVQHAAGGSSERILLYIALILADQLTDRHLPESAGGNAELLERVAERLEAVASALEEPVPDA